MDLRKLRMFLAVVEHGTITRAARASFVSQPGMSQTIRELETDLGAQLFDRVGRNIKLTEAGRALVGPAHQLIRDDQHARDAVSAVATGETGRLDLACLPTLNVDPAAYLIGAFRAAHPGVTVRLADPDDPGDVIDIVRSGEVEVAITVDSGAINGMIVVQIGTQAMQMIFPPGTPKPRVPLTPKMLATIPIVANTKPSSTRRLLDDVYAAAGKAPNIVVETSQREAILPLVLAGAGAALVPEATANLAVRLGAVVVPCRPSVARGIALIYRDAPLSGAAQHFIAIGSTTPPTEL